MRAITHLILDRTFGFADAVAVLLALPGARPGKRIEGERCYLDTRSRGLLHRNLLLECDTDAQSTELHLRSGDRTLISPAWQDRIPAGAVDVMDDDARQPIVEAIGAQELVVIDRRAIRTASVCVGKRDGVPRAVFVVEQWPSATAGETLVSVRVLADRAKRQSTRELITVLDREFQCVVEPATVDPQAIDFASAQLPAILMRENPVIAPETDIAAALREILAHHFLILTTREQGIAADFDTEFLHDFRIALRRMRSLFDSFRALFDKRVAGLLKADLKWLNRASGGRRDLDVFLHQFPDLRETVPREFSTALDELREFIVAERVTAQQRLAEALASERYEVFKSDWRALLDGSGLGDDAPSHDVVEAAGLSIWKTYRRIRKQARAHQTTDDIESLHALRKDCKKLRYQIEAFRSVFPRKRLVRAVTELKQLQDMLGAVCDLSVQQRFLIQRRDQLVEHADKTGNMERLLAALLGRYADGEAQLRHDSLASLDRFASKRVMRRYRDLFAR